MKGRWPANTLLMHLPGCRQVGRKKVKKPGGSGGASSDLDRADEMLYMGGQPEGFSVSHYDPDGTETIDAWECAPGCPVADLDQQSGERRSAGHYPSDSVSDGDRIVYGLGAQGQLYIDKGGASRFFKQVQVSEEDMAELLTIAVARKPLSESSVAKNVLKHGTGGINIDKTRVKSGPSQGGTSSGSTAFGQGSGWNSHENRTTEINRTLVAGRWPANTLLMHLPGCKQVGSKKVKAKQLTAGARTIQWGVSQGGCSYVKGTGARFASEDGTETIDAWECAPGCPVADLDQQSGDCPSTLSGRVASGVSYDNPGSCKRTGFTGGDRGRGLGGGAGVVYADKGGASRFFQPVQSETNLISYLLDLVVPDDQRPQGCIAESDVKLALWKDYGAEAFCAIITRGTPTEKDAKHMLRVLKPGGYLLLLSPADQPTGHTGMCRVEDAGFEIRDTILVAGQPGVMHYVPKAARREREAGCRLLPGKTGAQAVERKEGTKGLQNPRAGAGRTASHVKNHHPTCKPVKIMVRLLGDDVPKDLPVWDPFLGSGTTGVACLKTGHDFVGVEREEEYAQIAAARIRYWDRTLPGRWTGAEIKSDLDPDPESVAQEKEELDFMDWAEDQ